jgi:hypothetical protein
MKSELRELLNAKNTLKLKFDNDIGTIKTNPRKKISKFNENRKLVKYNRKLNNKNISSRNKKKK